MSEERRTGKCEECSRIREMATKQLCYRCYRRHQRAKERAEESPYSDITTPPFSRDARRVYAAYPKLLDVLSDLRVSQDHVREIIDICRPYLKPARQWLNIDERQFVEEPVDTEEFGEREHEADVHVHEDKRQLESETFVTV
jgi:hypothetical protein